MVKILKTSRKRYFGHQKHVHHYDVYIRIHCATTSSGINFATPPHHQHRRHGLLLCPEDYRTIITTIMVFYHPTFKRRVYKEIKIIILLCECKRYHGDLHASSSGNADGSFERNDHCRYGRDKNNFKKNTTPVESRRIANAK